MDDDAWFLPKRHGYGAGLPIRWQGWALLIAFFAVLAIDMVVLRPHMPSFWAVILAATAVLIVVSAFKTRGGWRWRWGEID